MKLKILTYLARNFEEKLMKITKIKINFHGFTAKKTTLFSRPSNQSFISGPLTGNKQGNASAAEQGFLFSRAAVKGNNLSRSLSSTESASSQSRNILIHTSCSQDVCVSIFYQGSTKVSPSRTSSVFFRKLEETHQLSFHFGLGEKLSNSPSVTASSGILSSVHFNEPRQECFNGTENRENVKKRCNKICSSISDL